MSATQAEDDETRVEDGEEYASVKLFAADHQDLAKLSALRRNTTIARLHRELCSAAIKRALRKEMEKQIVELGGGG
jgi:hypothetical protein